MATIHGQRPVNAQGSHGETLLADALIRQFPGPNNHMWFNLRELPNVPEIDALVTLDGLGCFLIEVKGHRIEHISNYEYGVLHTTDQRMRSTHPVDQAQKASWQLQAFLRLTDEKIPWIHLVVAFPQISRSQWKSRFGLDRDSETFIFADDLTSARQLNARLNALIEVPLRGLAGPKRLIADNKRLAHLHDIVTGTARRPIVTEGEQRRLLKPKRNFRERAALHMDRRQQLIEVSGFPGTGKTWFLCTWARQRAAQGESVLLVSFNQCLAAELRRIMHGVPDLERSAKGFVAIVDGWQLLKQVWDSQVEEPKKFKIAGTAWDIPNVDDRFKQRAAWLSSDPTTRWPKFDAVAIDEGQDMPQNIMWLLDRVSTSECSWMIACGKGQELYRPAADYPYAELVQRSSAHQEQVPLRRRMRAQAHTFYISQAVIEHYPKTQRAVEFVRRNLNNKEDDAESNQLDLFYEDLYREAADAPEFEVRGYPKDPEDLRLLLKEFTQYAATRGPHNRQMILFPNSTHSLVKPTRQILRELQIPYIDQVENLNRRKAVEPGILRLTTFHSARGVDGTDCLVFGLDQLHTKHASQTQLAYIAVSRAKSRTIICKDPSRPQALSPESPSFTEFLIALSDPAITAQH